MNEVSEIPMKKIYNPKTKTLYETIIKPNQLIPNSNEVICNVKLICINYDSDFEILKRIGLGVCNDYDNIATIRSSKALNSLNQKYFDDEDTNNSHHSTIEGNGNSRSSSLQSSIFTKKRGDSNLTNYSSNKNSIVSGHRNSIVNTPKSKITYINDINNVGNSPETERIKKNFDTFDLNNSYKNNIVDQSPVFESALNPNSNFGYYAEYLLNSNKLIIPVNKIIVKLFKIGCNIDAEKSRLKFSSKYLIYPFHNCISLNFSKPCENCLLNYTSNCLNGNEIGLNIEGGLQDYLVLTNPHDFLIEIPKNLNSHDALLSLDLMLPFYSCLTTYKIKKSDNILIVTNDKSKQINDFLLILRYFNYERFKIIDNSNLNSPQQQSQYLRFNYVIDFVCTDDSISYSLNNLLPQSKYILLSKKFNKVSLPLHKLFLKNISIHTNLNFNKELIKRIFEVLIKTPKSKNHAWLYYNKDFVSGDLSYKKISNLFGAGYDRFCYSNKRNKNNWV